MTQKTNQETKIIRYDSIKRIILTESIEIIFRSSLGERKVCRIKKPKICIGSSLENDIIISDDYISRKHCKLELSDEGLVLIDLGSTNGTSYEGEKIERIHLSRRGKFTIGKTEIQYKIIESEEALSPYRDRRFGNMIGASRSIRQIFSLVKKVAKTDVTVLITGESGTGKELVAMSLHEESTREKAPFIAINCGAIPANIIESEFFGHEKGAFTGAEQTRRGVFEQAHLGTLFLDEIGEMSIDLQTRLLRVLETKTVRRIGGYKDIPVDVRIIAATNQDLKKRVRDGKFREDLFFRLYIIPIHIPSLRERPIDIEVLAEHFTDFFSRGRNCLTSQAIQKIKQHKWPGNVRELKNTIQRAVILSKGVNISSKEIDISEFIEDHTSTSAQLVHHEKNAIINALKSNKGNQSKTANFLGIGRATLANKIKKYTIDLAEIKG